jgi:hypothetical protein
VKKSLKTATALLAELLQATKPPEGVAVVLAESKPNSKSNTNWIVDVGKMDPLAAVRYHAKVVELRKSTPIVDWRDVKVCDGARRLSAKCWVEI